MPCPRACDLARDARGNRTMVFGAWQRQRRLGPALENPDVDVGSVTRPPDAGIAGDDPYGSVLWAGKACSS
jgi:hypothetical protein